MTVTPALGLILLSRGELRKNESPLVRWMHAGYEKALRWIVPRPRTVLLASGAVSGPLDSDMRLTLRTDTAEVEALFQITPVGDTISLGAEFVTRRHVGRSRRGLPLWEEDTYRRVVRLEKKEYVMQDCDITNFRVNK